MGNMLHRVLNIEPMVARIVIKKYAGHRTTALKVRPSTQYLVAYACALSQAYANSPGIVLRWSFLRTGN